MPPAAMKAWLGEITGRLGRGGLPHVLVLVSSFTLPSSGNRVCVVSSLKFETCFMVECMINLKNVPLHLEKKKYAAIANLIIQISNILGFLSALCGPRVTNPHRLMIRTLFRATECCGGLCLSVIVAITS